MVGIEFILRKKKKYMYTVLRTVGVIAKVLLHIYYYYYYFITTTPPLEEEDAIVITYY